MKVIAAILADLERSPIGTRSRLAEPLAGVPVLRRTVERVLAAPGLEAVHVLTAPAQRGAAQRLLEGLAAVVHPADLAPAPHQLLASTARKWALANWRGGVGGVCAFDEDFHAAALLALAKAVGADGVMAAPAHAALLNPTLAREMLEHFGRVGQDYRFVFTQAPPGLAPVIVTVPLLAELAQAGCPLGTVLAYRPAGPEPDLVGKPCCWQAPTAVAGARGRLMADTQESFAACEAALRELGEAGCGDPVAVSRWLAQRLERHVPSLPAEVEIELTTQDALPGTVLRPRGGAVPPRGPMDLDLWAKLLGQLALRDDALLVLGGFGDPLCHPQWARTVRLAREAGVFGIAVQTTGKRLAQVGAEAVMADPPDLLAVWLDAATDQTYRQVQGEGGYEQASQAVLALEEARRLRHQVKPLLVPMMTKARPNVADLEAFFDFWMQNVGACHVEGYSDRGGAMARLQVASMAPPGRTPCRRPRSRLLVLADGRAVSCDQDFRGVQVVGDLAKQSLDEVWQGEALRRLRAFLPQAKAAGDGADWALCRCCQEWARP